MLLGAYSRIGWELRLEEKAEAVKTLESLWSSGYSIAAHQLGKVWRNGLCGIVDEQQAERWFHRSANAGNDCSAYALGKLYLQGREVEQDLETAKDFLTRSAAQGNEYAHFFLNHIGWYTGKSPSAFLAATRLLRSVAGVFRDNSIPPANPAGMRVDSKRRKKLFEKRLAMGHKADDHEDESLQAIKL